MSWYSDREPFNEYDPPYCKYCTRSNLTKEKCDKCVERHEQEGDDDELGKRNTAEIYERPIWTV